MKSYLFFILFFLIGCKSPISPFQKVFVEKFNATNKGDSCKMNFADITPFKWDSLYIVDNSDNIDSLNNFLKGQIKQNFKQNYIFVKNDSIIFQEPFPFSTEDFAGNSKYPLDIDIIFQKDNIKNNIEKFTNSNAIFVAHLTNIDGVKVFTLK